MGYTHLTQCRAGVENSVVILEQFEDVGYAGSLTTVKNYITDYKNLVPSRRQQTAPQSYRGHRYKTDTGEVFQMDRVFTWGVDPNGNESKVACFAMICHHYGKMYIEFFPNAKQANLFIGMIHAFYMMGSAKYILTDNIKSVVDKRDLDGHPVWNKC